MARRASYDRDEVVARAQALFWRKGYHATSLKDLEGALNLRPGSIYAAFGSKEGLFAETLRIYGQNSREQLAEALATAASPLAGLADHVRELGCAPDVPAPSRACMLVKTLLEVPDDDPALRSATEEMMALIEGDFAAAFSAARTAGELPDSADPQRLASRLQAAIFGLRAYAQRRDSQDRVAALAEDIARDLEALRQA
ncbi:TetR/AcrR family transcriptional regulator [Paracoccus xiamenensis]|uniref:TetR/AcrR family transcriptional regulator n=1 Tax=Paracoccus xiamenensis TaxID=2714901 RepID=UPI0014087CF5|nr:TetR/AcrR family transcriptional regulator [Paracoccus xiamenensis]NHF73662.1 TetR/AcrR family transcriptional regulator [Paracoccus xiamenensis]